jgi:UDP-N-acetylmuramate--alanine ligase
MHIYFSGIGGTAIGPLALIAHQAGYQVAGSDKQSSQYIEYLRTKGLGRISIGQTIDNISEVHKKTPIDWIVVSSAILIEQPDHPELTFAQKHGIRVSKRDELLNEILNNKNLKLIAIAGTHGKTTTTAMAIWLFKQLNVPISYSVGAKIPFGDMGHYEPNSEYFVYECDEFDRNFLAFYPYMSLITGIDYDHHEIFPTREDYQSAFRQFMNQSEHSLVWRSNVVPSKLLVDQTYTVLDDNDEILNKLSLVGEVNRRNAWQVVSAVHAITGEPILDLIQKVNDFPGLSRRFEKITDNLYTDYAHTPPKIAGCLQVAREMSNNVVVVYEPLTNRRQHYIKEAYKDLFKDVKRLYWVPSYLAREDPNQATLSPTELIEYMDNKRVAEPSKLNDLLKSKIQTHIDNNDLVVCLSGGGGGSLDEWLRTNFGQSQTR